MAASSCSDDSSSDHLLNRSGLFSKRFLNDEDIPGVVMNTTGMVLVFMERPG